LKGGVANGVKEVMRKSLRRARLPLLGKLGGREYGSEKGEHCRTGEKGVKQGMEGGHKKRKRPNHEL